MTKEQDFDIQFGKRLAAARLDRGKKLSKKVTQKMVAEAVGIGERHYNDLERLGNIPNGKTLAKIGEYLECSIDWLLLGSGSEGRRFRDEARVATQFAPTGREGETLKDGIKTSDMVAKAIEILDSKTVYGSALAVNIKAFHRLTQTPSSMQGIDGGMADVEDSDQGLADIERRFAELEKENAELKIRLDEHRKAKGHRADHFEEHKKSEGT